MNLGYGFVYGNNFVGKDKIEYWLHTTEITWNAFIYYIAQYIKIVDYNDRGITVEIVSEKQREHFYKKVCEYSEEIWVNNFTVDKENSLWKDHHRGRIENYCILERVLK